MFQITDSTSKMSSTIVDCVIIHWSTDKNWIFSKKFSILTFSAKTTSHESHLNITHEKVKSMLSTVQNGYSSCSLAYDRRKDKLDTTNQHYAQLQPYPPTRKLSVKGQRPKLGDDMRFIILKFRAIGWQFWDKFQPSAVNFYDDSGSSRVIIYAF